MPLPRQFNWLKCEEDFEQSADILTNNSVIKLSRFLGTLIALYVCCICLYFLRELRGLPHPKNKQMEQIIGTIKQATQLNLYCLFVAMKCNKQTMLLHDPY